MIMRIFQVTTHPGKEAEFARFFHEVAIPMMKSTPGLVRLLPGLPHGDHPNEFSMVMVWDSLDALKAFVGEDYTNPHIDPSEADLVKFRRISHYDLIEI
ncbi:antibiotic biosynthesis monooxygenase family protein [Tropicimonas isoalkanivorans]|uniref:Antibiotic biosynthesis monooxygenase n=1 Tax=Tropicimonas isoalkanivorans TaxID=441112 RepID=A0A1I1ECT1_9RHOB|nr:antibiotic biosynthesis monooxygenase [Tropicimonas isoalkanivorans]SFB84566.1 Antibiotic biosynthesis monooxygenase [Tropicimonas isoalkanivorans]